MLWCWRAFLFLAPAFLSSWEDHSHQLSTWQGLLCTQQRHQTDTSNPKLQHRHDKNLMTDPANPIPQTKKKASQGFTEGSISAPQQDAHNSKFHAAYFLPRHIPYQLPHRKQLKSVLYLLSCPIYVFKDQGILRKNGSVVIFEAQ